MYDLLMQSNQQETEASRRSLLFGVWIFPFSSLFTLSTSKSQIYARYRLSMGSVTSVIRPAAAVSL